MSDAPGMFDAGVRDAGVRDAGMCDPRARAALTAAWAGGVSVSMTGELGDESTSMQITESPAVTQTDVSTSM